MEKEEEEDFEYALTHYNYEKIKEMVTANNRLVNLPLASSWNLAVVILPLFHIIYPDIIRGKSEETYEAIVLLLINHGANIFIRDQYGQCLLHYEQNLKLVNLYIQMGLDVNTVAKGCDDDDFYIQGGTPIEHVESIYRASITWSFNNSIYTTHLLAVAKLLLEAGAIYNGTNPDFLALREEIEESRPFVLK